MAKELNLRLHLFNEMNTVHVKFVLLANGTVIQESLEPCDKKLLGYDTRK